MDNHQPSSTIISHFYAVERMWLMTGTFDWNHCNSIIWLMILKLLTPMWWLIASLHTRGWLWLSVRIRRGDVSAKKVVYSLWEPSSKYQQSPALTVTYLYWLPMMLVNIIPQQKSITNLWHPRPSFPTSPGGSDTAQVARCQSKNWAMRLRLPLGCCHWTGTDPWAICCGMSIRSATIRSDVLVHKQVCHRYIYESTIKRSHNSCISTLSAICSINPTYRCNPNNNPYHIHLCVV